MFRTAATTELSANPRRFSEHVLGEDEDPIVAYGNYEPCPGDKDGEMCYSKERIWDPNGQISPIYPGAIDHALGKCDGKRNSQGECCRKLIGEDERSLIDPDIVRDIIIGLSDGLTVPFGLTAGLSSLGSSRLVVVAGIAELISGAISMGIGGYLASEAERDHFRYRQKVLRNRVARSCSSEMERRVRDIIGPLGVRDSLCQPIANDLLRAEEMSEEVSLSKDYPTNKGIFSNFQKFCARKPKSSDEVPMAESLQDQCSDGGGMTAFLLKFGEGKEEVPTSRLYISAFTIGFSYFLGGLIPMAPYFFVEKANRALLWSIGVMFLTLLIFGALKAYFTGARIGFVGYFKGSFSTIIVGGGAAAASYIVVKLLGGED